jgi:hypothetical protein
MTWGSRDMRAGLHGTAPAHAVSHITPQALLEGSTLCFCRTFIWLLVCMSRLHSVNWLGYKLDDGRIGFRSWPEQKRFLSSTASRPALRPSQPSLRWGALSPKVKQSGLEASNSPPSRAEVNNAEMLSVFSSRSEQLHCIASNDGMIDELRRICKETLVA